MSDESNKYLTDIISYILSIENYIGENKDFNIYPANKMLRRVVERELEIIGEAVSKLKKNRFGSSTYKLQENYRLKKLGYSFL